MSFLTFTQEMLGADLNELGFCRKKGTEWFKLIDDCIYLNVYVRKTSGNMIEIYCKARSLFSPFLDGFMHMNQVNNIFRQFRQSIGKDSFAVHFEDEDREYADRMINNGHEMFSIVKPLLASVADLQTCFAAECRLSFLEVFHGRSKILGRPYTQEDDTVFPPEDCFFLLYVMGRCEEAAQYLKRSVDNYLRDYCRSSNDLELVELHRESLTPFIRMIEAEEHEMLYNLITENYHHACDLLEERYRIKIDRNNGLGHVHMIANVTE